MMNHPLFVVDLDRYGRAGHQTTRMLTGFLLAHFFNGKFLAVDYKFFPYRMNSLLDFTRSRLAFKSGFIGKTFSVSAGYREPHGNDCFDTNTPEGLKKLISEVSTKIQSCALEGNNYCIVKLPFDQEPGLLSKMLWRNDVKEDLRLVTVQKKENLPKQKKISIHIRRGDVTKDRFPSWWIDDEVYIYIIDNILRTYSTTLEIHVLSQQPVTEYLTNALQKLNLKFPSSLQVHISAESWTNGEEVEHLRIISESCLVIGSKSSFSCLGALLGNAKYMLVTNEEINKLAFGIRPHAALRCDNFKENKNSVKSFVNTISLALGMT